MYIMRVYSKINTCPLYKKKQKTQAKMGLDRMNSKIESLNQKAS